MWRHFAKGLAVGLAVFSLSGCASLNYTFSESGPDWLTRIDLSNKVYVGARADIDLMVGAFDSDRRRHMHGGGELLVIGLPFFLLDLPLSLVMDTVFLPYTIPKTRSTSK
jgi:uncharacterized protein YceK